MKEIHGKDAKWDEIEKTAKAKYENLFGGNNDDPGITAWQAYQSATELATKPATPTGGSGAGTTTGSGSGSGRTGLEKTWYHDKDKHWQRYWKDGKWSKYNEGPHTPGPAKVGENVKCTVCGRVLGFKFKEDSEKQAHPALSPDNTEHKYIYGNDYAVAAKGGIID